MKATEWEREHNPFGALYRDRPRLVMHDRIRHYRDAVELVRVAEEKGFDVSYKYGYSPHEVQISSGDSSLSPMKNCSLVAALREVRGRAQ